MPEFTKFEELPFDLARLRLAYFDKEFWENWRRMSELQKEAFILGWISELEQAVRKLSERLLRIEEQLEDEAK